MATIDDVYNLLLAMNTDLSAVKAKTDILPVTVSVSGVVESDPLISNVTNRLLFDDLVAGTPFDDITEENWVVTNGTVLDANSGKFGEGGLVGGNGHYAYKENFNLSSTAFTVDLWVKVAASTPSSYNCAVLQFGIGLNGKAGFLLYAREDGYVIRTSGNAQLAPSTTMTQWNHVAIEYTGGQIYLFLNGVKSLSYAPGSVFDVPRTLFIGGGNMEYATNLTLNIDEVRITQGTTRYNGIGFATPTESIAPAPVTTYAVSATVGSGNTADYTSRFDDVDYALATLTANNMRNNLVEGIVSSTNFVGLLDNLSNELTGGTPAYQRQAIVWSSPFNSIVTNTTDIIINVPAGSTVAHIAGFGSMTGGTAEFSYACTTVTATNQSVYTIPAGTVQMTVTVV